MESKSKTLSWVCSRYVLDVDKKVFITTKRRHGKLKNTEARLHYVGSKVCRPKEKSIYIKMIIHEGSSSITKHIGFIFIHTNDLEIFTLTVNRTGGVLSLIRISRKTMHL